MAETPEGDGFNSFGQALRHRFAAFSPDGARIVTASWDRTARVWALPPILLADAKTQVKLACKKLSAAHAPLAFRVTDIATYPVLQGQTVDPGDPAMLASPCRG